MTDARPPSLRERTRQAVQGELVDAAQVLILERGYDAVTVDDITARVGVSKRSFFRYFASKDDILLGRYDLFGDRLVEALDARPNDEVIWVSLRRMFDPVVSLFEDENHQAESRAVHGIVLATPSLHAGYLERFDRMQERVADRVLQRLAIQGHDVEVAAVRALVGAAFACLQAATRWTSEPGVTQRVAPALDTAMSILRPADPRLAGRA